jgi:hypothetical protein
MFLSDLSLCIGHVQEKKSVTKNTEESDEDQAEGAIENTCGASKAVARAGWPVGDALRQILVVASMPIRS